MRTTLPVVALGAPLVAGMALLLSVVISERMSLGWFGRPFDHVTLSEAAGIPRASIVLKLIRKGANPNSRYAINRGVVGNDHPLLLTPLEAAVMSRELAVVKLLDANGARRDAAVTARLIQLAKMRHADDITAYLRN